jgi:hypothetical protein
MRKEDGLKSFLRIDWCYYQNIRAVPRQATLLDYLTEMGFPPVRNFPFPI